MKTVLMVHDSNTTKEKVGVWRKGAGEFAKEQLGVELNLFSVCGIRLQREERKIRCIKKIYKVMTKQIQYVHTWNKSVPAPEHNKDFSDRFALVEEKRPAVETVRKATQSRIGRFTKQDILDLCPSLSLSSVEGALRKMVASGELKREGNGKATFYIRLK